jgi:hypothetical protein
MGSPKNNNWPALSAAVLILCGICTACGGGGQGMTDYQRSQVQLQQQQLNQQAFDSARLAAQSAMNNATQLLNAPVPDYGTDPSQSQTNCVTGTDYMGRLVTQCNSQ